MIIPDRKVMLEMRKVSLDFHTSGSAFDRGVHHVLERVSFKLYEGETLGIIGRNGVGKTTMLRVMAGILAPTRGTVNVRQDMTVSLLTIGLGFLPDLSGRDNAFFSAMLQGSSKRQAKAYLAAIREFSELGDSFEEPVKTYSAGMKSRLGFTTALMTHVDILLIDEILSVGDAHFRAKAEQAMKERIVGNQTVVLVSHNHAQVRAMCDRSIWIEAGKVAGEGDTNSLLERYVESLNSPS